MHVLLPALHPSNRGMYQQMCAQFVSVFLDAICNRRELEMIEDSVIPDHARLAQTDYDRLFAVFREVLHRMLNAKDARVLGLGIGCSMHICILAPRRFVPWVVDGMYQGLESFEHHRLMATLILLGQVPKFLFSPGFAANGDKHLVPLIHLLLPAIDVNDPRKTLSALTVLLEVMQTVTFVDCSGHIPADASPEEQEAMEATCQLEPWLDSFLDTVFEFVEGISGVALSAEFRNNTASFDVVLQGVFLQLSPALTDRAVDRVAQWVLERHLHPMS